MPTTIPFKELDGSPKESWGANGATATREILCAWDDRFTLKTEILGDGYEFGATTPIEYPDQPGVVAMTVSSQRFGKQQASTMTDLEGDLTAYDNFAKLTIGYRQIIPSSQGAGDDEPNHENGTILEYSTSGAAEYVLLSPNGMGWANRPDQQVPEKAAPTKRVPLTQHQLTWNLVAAPPWTALKTQSGTVNNAPFLGYEANSLLFDSYTATKEFATAFEFSNPQIFWKISFVFLSRRFIGPVGKDDGGADLGDVDGDGNPLANGGFEICGWQHVWRPTPAGAGGWDRMIIGNQAGPYQQSDFENLLIYP